MRQTLSNYTFSRCLHGPISPVKTLPDLKIFAGWASAGQPIGSRPGRFDQQKKPAFTHGSVKLLRRFALDPLFV
jgi:hypothetical protein